MQAFLTPIGQLWLRVNGVIQDIEIRRRPKWKRSVYTISERYCVELSADQLRVCDTVEIEFHPNNNRNVIPDYDSDESEMWSTFSTKNWSLSIGIAMPWHWDNDNRTNVVEYEVLPNGGSKITIPLVTWSLLSQFRRGVGIAWVPCPGNDDERELMRILAYTDFASVPDFLFAADNSHQVEWKTAIHGRNTVEKLSGVGTLVRTEVPSYRIHAFFDKAFDVEVGAIDKKDFEDKYSNMKQAIQFRPLIGREADEWCYWFSKAFQ